MSNPLLSSSATLLAIESSCDDTAAAVIRDNRLRSSVVSSQLVHERYGGVVPEVASRAHQRMIVETVNAALERADAGRDTLDAIAVTHGPGLAGSLMVGVSFAKAMALGLDVPLIGVNHIEGHIYSVFTEQKGPRYPFLCLVVSGGHTQLMLVEEPLKHKLLGRTRDDAAGEAFDKIAKLFGLEYPGGPVIDRLAKAGDPTFHRFPRSRPDRYDFSFSGLKTSVLYYLNAMPESERTRMVKEHVADLCASVQEAVVETLVSAMKDAVEETGVEHVAIVGGVSANSRLREAASAMADQVDVQLHVPHSRYCTDNAAMIATAGLLKLGRGERSPLTLTPDPSLSL